MSTSESNLKVEKQATERGHAVSISDARLDELIEWGESYAARPGSPRADTTLALHELRERRSLPWTAAPEMLAEIERLRDALALLIGTIEAHEIESLQCDRTEERYCNCLRENAARAKALLLPAQQCAQEGRS